MHWGLALPPESLLRYTLELTPETPSNNQIRGLHFAAYRSIRKDWQMRVFVGLGARRPKLPLSVSFLDIERRSSGELDWDNAYGGLKPLLDCLVMPSRRNPDGLGLIQDDSPKHMPLPPFIRQVKAPPGHGSTLLRIYDVSSLTNLSPSE